ncbi:MAG: trimethylamine methyltransferase family protein [Candidatus Omnitrophica bacterium]|nr:trimethylamine methyltransferase family protein [Candidatus Omnitrophota bacterium]MCM8828969.1 trimethylamine methyltransferase family protein [Candidatus Omnitrophota bacterium]
MKRVWKISGGLNENEITQIHTAALELIEKVGILTPSAQALKMIEGKSGIKIKDNRVFIQPQVIEELLGPFPRKTIEDDREPSFHISGYALRCYDIRTGEIRNPTTDDMVEFAKIGHTLGASGCSIVMPKNIPQKLAEVATYKLCMDVSDRVYGAGIFSDADVFDIIQEMLVITEKKYNVGMHMISPMAFDPFLLEMAIRYIPKKADFSVGNMPMSGATSPVDFFGALVQSCAEVLGGSAILKIIAPESDISFTFFIYPFDMRYGTIVYGGPDFIKGNLILNQVARFYGTTVMAKAFNTMAKFPDDAQVGINLTGCVLLMLCGLKKFGWSGTCCIDEIGSIEKVIIDYEIFKMAKHITDGLEIEPYDVAGVVQECLNDGFLVHRTTVENFRKQFFESEIFSNETFSSWDSGGRKRLVDKTREKALKLLKQHNFERDKNQQKELDRIWEKAKKLFSS